MRSRKKKWLDAVPENSQWKAISPPPIPEDAKKGVQMTAQLELSSEELLSTITSILTSESNIMADTMIGIELNEDEILDIIKIQTEEISLIAEHLSNTISDPSRYQSLLSTLDELDVKRRVLHKLFTAAESFNED